ncbi:hypothetical protein [Roseicyclus persicicus]|uniref:Uncharacterized protein n=1 Tax=Roseicyclus persicicus TaxID=2650661 RepID=A0A7X6K071_9RHOB|nr:hypothetical protein [Roseibacterium persicicum]NKX45955.1 hypothetical protein [Roseibacterium persicicum]
MSVSTDFRKTTALVGVILVATTLGADAYTVSRCSALQDGAYRTVLLIEANGRQHMHFVGQDGLTRSIAYDEGRALSWAAERYGASSSWAMASDCVLRAVRGPAGAGTDLDDDDSGSGYMGG